jgi:fibronectin type 3 domain-containing protein
MQSPPEPALRDLIVESGASAGALDTSARFGQSYEYTAQRIERISIAGKTLELPGEISAPVQVKVLDTFPPAIPQGLAAIFVPEEKTIDLSWQPDTEPDLAGYIVYRAGQTENDWQRISGTQPLTAPSYRDAAAVPGQNYRYAITAIDQTGHESQRSPIANESVPNP